MALSRFTRSDLIYFRKAFAEPTHAEMNDLDTLFGTDTGSDGAIKSVRASRVISALEARADTDQDLLAAINLLYVDGRTKEQRDTMLVFRNLVTKVLSPRGVLFDEHKGYNFESGVAADAALGASPSGMSVFDSFFNTNPASAPGTSEPWRGGREAPALAIVSSAAPAASATAEAAAPAPVVEGDVSRPNSVFIVQGRDERPVAALETFIHFLGMDVITWGDARRMTGVAQPETFQIVKTGLEKSGAVIVIFSPDEEARLRPQLNGREDARGNPTPGEPGFQPRQNVLLEAGLAFGLAPGRTIFVRSSSTMRAISDIVGFHFITMDGSWDERQALVDALENADTHPAPKRPNLGDRLAGPFKVDEWK